MNKRVLSKLIIIKIILALFSCTKQNFENKSIQYHMINDKGIARIDSLIHSDFELSDSEIQSFYNKISRDTDAKSTANLFYYKIAVNLKNNNLDSILYYANQGKTQAIVLENKEIENKIEYLLGRYYLLRSDYPRSMESYLKALNYFEKNKNVLQLGYVNNDLGILYLELSEFENSLSAFKNSINFFKKIENPRGLAIAYGNLANLYIYLNEYDLALKYVHKSLDFFNDSQNFTNIIKGVFMLSDIEHRKGNNKQALLYLDKAYQIAEEKEKVMLKGIALMNYGSIYMSEKRYEKALFVYNQALGKMKNEKQPRYQLDILERLWFILEKMGRHKEGNKYLKQYYVIKDSISGTEVKHKIEEIRWNSIFEKQRYENKLLETQYKVEKQKHQNQRRTNLIIIVVVLVLGVTILSLYHNKTKNLKISKLESTRLEEKLQAETDLQELERQKYEQETKARSELEYLKRKQHEFEMKAKNELQLLQKQQYRMDLESKNRELAAINLQLLSKNKLFTEVEKIIENRSYSKERLFFELKKSIRQNKNIEKDWAQFQEVFQTIHPNFFETLHQKYSSLTHTEIRICAYIKIKLANHEIASLLNINQSSLMSSRYRIRKKMGLEYTDDLDSVIRVL